MADVEDVLSIEFDRAVRLGRPLSLLMLVRRDMPLGLPQDILQQASAAIGHATRTYDSAGVIGESAIIVVLPETEAAGARVVADRLRVELANRNAGRRVWTVLEVAHAEQYGSTPRLLGAVRRLAATTHAA